MRFVKSAALNITTVAIQSIGSFLVISIIGRSFSAEDFGLYSYIMRILNMSSFVLISISMFIFSYYFQKKKDEVGEIFYATILSLSIIAGIVFVFISAFAEEIAPPDIKSLTPFIIGMGALLLFVARGIYSEAFNGLFEFKKRTFTEFIRMGCWLLFISALAYFHKLSLINAIMVLYVIHIGYLVIAHILSKERYEKTKISFRKTIEITKYALQKTKLFTLSTLFNFNIIFLTFFFLARIKGSEALGIFSYSFYFSFFITTIAAGFSGTILPFTARVDKEQASNYLWASNFSLGYLFLFLFTISILFVDPIMKIVFNREMAGYGERTVFVLLLISSFIKAISGNMGSSLNGLGETRETFKISTITLIFQIVIGYVLIVKYSIVGAAISLTMVHLLQFILASYYIQKKGFSFKFYSPRYFLKVIKGFI